MYGLSSALAAFENVVVMDIRSTGCWAASGGEAQARLEQCEVPGHILYVNWLAETPESEVKRSKLPTLVEPWQCEPQCE